MSTFLISKKRAFLQAPLKADVKGNKMSDKDSKMSAMSELQPYFDSYLEKMRKAKNSSGLTLQELSDLSGVPYNNICDTNSGRTKQPLLFYEAAKCKTLGLSLNALCGLDEPRMSDFAQRQRIHELELKNVQQAGDVRRLTEVNVEKDKRLYSHRPMLYALIAMCVILTMALIGYMIFDASVTTAGLFKSARTSTFAILLIIIALLSLVVIFLAVKSDLSWNRKEK